MRNAADKLWSESENDILRPTLRTMRVLVSLPHSVLIPFLHTTLQTWHKLIKLIT